MYRAKVSFSGIVSMAEGEVKNITDDAVAKDLLKAGYIEEVKPAEKVNTTKAKTNKTKTEKGA